MSSGKNRPLDFQRATADRIYKLFTDAEHPRQRVLVADEVGLGKTTVASEVVSMMRDYSPFQMDQFYRVVYVCSNINIAKQNINQFGIDDKLNVDESRLSMQHLILASKEKEIADKFIGESGVPEIIIPLTPFTSFNFSSSAGSAPERAMIYCYLSRMDEIRKEELASLSLFLKTGNVKQENWESKIEDMKRKIASLDAKEVTDVLESLRRKGGGIIEELKAVISLPEDSWRMYIGRIISGLRRTFADISLERLQPDLVIMDEFQRFKSLLSDNDDEQSMIARKFFGNKDVKILLLSATPYKPYSTLEELNETGDDEHFQDFKQVVNFLNGNNPEAIRTFNEVWSKYNVALTQVTGGDFAYIYAAKQDAERNLYGMMCRTERFNAGNITTKEVTLQISGCDVRSYFESRSVLDMINEHSERHDFTGIPIEYVKSSPYIFSFMEGYKLKQFVSVWEKSRRHKDHYPFVYIPYDKVNGFGRVPCNNAKLEYLYQSLFEGSPIYGDEEQYGRGYTSEKLLWVPASHPYYRTHGVFKDNEGFSKCLIFSAWEMVPRMLSVMLTYNSERIIVDGLRSRKIPTKRYYNKEKNNVRYGVGRLAKIKDEDNPLLYPSEYLASLYNPVEWLGKDIYDIKASVKGRLTTELDRKAKELGLEYSNQCSSAKVRHVMEMLDGAESVELDGIPVDSIDILANAAIASPAICAFRKTGDKDVAESVGQYFVTLFTRSESVAVVDVCFGARADGYVDAILDYCVEGNLQSVLDEFYSVIGEDQWKAFFGGTPAEAVPINVYMQDTDGNITKETMRTSYAVQFANTKMESKAVARVASIRTSFNSPFRPFVLATTSVGQEGLDFHQYARKLVHWNLPSNPVDMEQREGRVNRFRCLSIRQRLAARYPDIYEWDDIYRTAAATYKQNYSDMVPSWCLPPEFNDNGSRTVERIILQYPMSIDAKRYEKLEKVLSLYRLTMGQPRQEKLLEMLCSSNLTEEQAEKLMINLSPFKQK